MLINKDKPQTETLMAFPLFAMMPTGKRDLAAGGQPEMAAIIQGGMTLRDYFATAAMEMAFRQVPLSGSTIREERKSEFMSVIAKASYQMAEAMLKAREI